MSRQFNASRANNVTTVPARFLNVFHLFLKDMQENVNSLSIALSLSFALSHAHTHTPEWLVWPALLTHWLSCGCTLDAKHSLMI